MGHFIDGEWTTTRSFADGDGTFRRKATTFRERVETPEAGRYRLYVSYACPWAHRTLIARALLGLEHVFDVAVVHHFMGEDGWTFAPGAGVVHDAEGTTLLRDVYLRADPRFTGRVTVPILWDTREESIVNNESREIVRMMSDVFRSLGHGERDLHPAALHDAIEHAIDAIYEPINNGVYRSGFARTQEAYEAAVSDVFEALDRWEGVLGRQRYLAGDQLTEADIFLFTTLVRFDLVYHYHFKCNRRRIQDYPNLWGFTREIFQLPGVADTVSFDHITKHYFGSHESVNPTRVVPVGPEIDFRAPHGRG